MEEDVVHFVGAGFFALEEDGEGAVAFVSHPAADAEFLGVFLHIMAEADALHESGKAVFERGRGGWRRGGGGFVCHRSPYWHKNGVECKPL